ncbi:MAG: SMC-Scp complex subunit ScpB [Bdellovibrionales bacterium]|nr:SMC-Scp complex subunit ScpB [Bdellovibrionales bacterium]
MANKKNKKAKDVVVEEAVEAADADADAVEAAAVEVTEEELNDDLGESAVSFELEGEGFTEDSELAAFESAEIEEVESLLENEIVSIVESMLFATDKPQSLAVLKSAFQGTKVRTAHIRSAIETLQMEYANPTRGVCLEEVAGGYQIRTKPDNQKYLQRTVKGRPFRLSGPALEVLAIVAYKQPCTKSMVDEIRGVESGHLMRGLLDRGLMHFAGKSELPGRPMFYETTRKFLEIFSLRNLNELPSLNEIDQLIPEGIGEAPEEKQTLSDLTGELSTEVVSKVYSQGEEELMDISSELQSINTSSDFFEQEKARQKAKRDSEKAQDIRERMTVGEEVEKKDQRWLERYEAEQLAKSQPAPELEPVVEASAEIEAAAFDNETDEEIKVSESDVTDDIMLESMAAVDDEAEPIESI